MIMNALSFDGYRLRAPEPEDLEVMMHFENTPYQWETGCASGPYSRYQLKQYLQNSQNDLFADRQLRLMVESPQGSVVGIVDLFNFEPFHNRAEVGVVVMESVRGQGVARQAMQALCKHAFHHLGLHQLIAYVECNNEASLHLMRRCGFQEVACLTDWVRKGEGYADVVMLRLLHP